MLEILRRSDGCSGRRVEISDAVLAIEQGGFMPLSAWLTLVVVSLVLFGGVAWSVKISLRGPKDEQKSGTDSA